MLALNTALVKTLFKPVMGLCVGFLLSTALLTACQTSPHTTSSPVGADGVTIAGPQL